MQNADCSSDIECCENGANEGCDSCCRDCQRIASVRGFKTKESENRWLEKICFVSLVLSRDSPLTQSLCVACASAVMDAASGCAATKEKSAGDEARGRMDSRITILGSSRNFQIIKNEIQDEVSDVTDAENGNIDTAAAAELAGLFACDEGEDRIL